MKIATKINLSFFIVSTILASLVIGSFYVISKRNIINLVNAGLGAVSKSRAEHVETFLVLHEDIARTLAYSSVFQEFLKSDISDKDYQNKFDRVIIRLQDTVSGSISIFEAFLVDAKGVIRASSIKEHIGLDRSNDSYFLGAKDRPYIKGPYHSQLIKRSSLDISAPALDSNSNTFLGVVVLRINTDRLNSITAVTAGLGKSGEVYLVNKYGVMITPSRFLKDAALKERIDCGNAEWVEGKGGINDNKPSLYRNYRKKLVLGSHAYIPQVQWCLLAEIEAAEAFIPLTQTSIFTIIILLFVPLFFIRMGHYVSRKITKPIHDLHMGTEIIGGGNLDYSVRTDTLDEIGQLSRAFDLMRRRLKRSTVSVDKLNKEVIEREKAEKGMHLAYDKLREARDQLVQAEKLNALGRLASGVAHEVKNPLAIIMQSVDYLRDKIPAKEKEVLQMISDNIKRADDIVRTMVDFSRVSELNITPEDINPVLENSLTLVQHSIKVEGVEIKKEFGHNLPKVLIDRNKIEQVFINLLLNALQAMPDGGRLTIRSYLKNLDTAKGRVGRRNSDYFRLGEGAVTVEVEDTGVGIPSEDLHRVFDPFFTTKGPRGGSGLGLSVSKNIIDTHRAMIEIESQQGKGTKVIVTLQTAGG